MNDQSPVTIDVVSDVMCPWCYIGKRRLEKAVAELAAVPLDVRWRPFQLDATIPEGGMDRQKYLANKFGGKERAREVYEPIKQAGAAENIAFKFDAITRSPNTLDAHRVIRWAATAGCQDTLVERLFQLYFTEGADLTDKTVLADAAQAAGMEREVVERLLSGDADKDLVEKEIGLAQQMGVTGVPTFIIDNRFAVIGAQSAEVLKSAVIEALRTRSGEEAAE